MKLLDHINALVTEYVISSSHSSCVNPGLLLLVHCVYECPSIMQSVNDRNLVILNQLLVLTGMSQDTASATE